MSSLILISIYFLLIEEIGGRIADTDTFGKLGKIASTSDSIATGKVERAA